MVLCCHIQITLMSHLMINAGVLDEKILLHLQKNGGGDEFAVVCHLGL